MVMIFFPFLYEDELLYSCLARYHMYTGNENTKLTMEEVFGSSTLCAATTLPANLNQLTKRLPTSNSYSSEELINKHTFLPYFSPFIPKERYQELKLMMSESNGKTLYMKLGKTASTVKRPGYLRYCLECVQTERCKNGESYWHRVHQVEGVMICPIHGCNLLKSEVPYSERRNKHEFVSLDKIIRQDEIHIIKDPDEHLKFIAEQTHYLLNNYIPPFGLESLRNFYVIRLKQKGLTTVTGRIKWGDLIPMFNKFYGSELLKELNCYITPINEDRWLHKVLRKPRVSCHPLRHILLLGFLGETIVSLDQHINKVNFEPFGSEPWPCLNKAASHYKEPVIKSCVITNDYKMKVPVGTFSCECGFVYSRRGPDQNEDDKFKIGRIKEFGPVWERELSKLSKQGFSLRKMGLMLGVDPMTVKKKLILEEQTQINQTDNRAEEYRKEWAQLIKGNKEKTITEIRSLNPGVYTWLYRNDRVWLQNNYPEGVKNEQSSKRIDWEKRDSGIAEQIELITKKIISDTEKLIRVTKNEIGRRIEGLSLTTLYKNLERMPKTQNEINNYVESVEQFQVRRIKYIAKQLRESKPQIKEWELVRTAGLRKKFVQKHKIIIEQEIERLS